MVGSSTGWLLPEDHLQTVQPRQIAGQAPPRHGGARSIRSRFGKAEIDQAAGGEVRSETTSRSPPCRVHRYREARNGGRHPPIPVDKPQAAGTLRHKQTTIRQEGQ